MVDIDTLYPTQKVKSQILPQVVWKKKLFENDVSTAREAGTLTVPLAGLQESRKHI